MRRARRTNTHSITALSTNTVAASVLAGVAALTVACSSSATPAATTTSAASTTAAAASTGASATGASATGGTQLSGTTITPAELSARLVAGYKDVTSGQGTLEAGVAGQTVNATFEGTFSQGQPTGISVNMTLPVSGSAVPVDIILADGQLYMSSPPLLSQIGISKEWLLISADSTNPTVVQIADQVQGTLSSLGSPDQTAQLANSAQQITEVGQETHNGVEATHYQLLLDPTAMAAAEGQSAAPSVESAVSSVAAATESIVVDMWVDDQDRVIGTTTNVEVSGQQVSAVYEITSFNEPVTITAPDPADVATG